MTGPAAPTELVQLLTETFPTHSELPWDCWISEAIAANQWDFGREIEVATRCGARLDMIRRLSQEHPVTGAHKEQHDHRLISVFSEIEALAWAVEVARLDSPQFVAESGCPDIRAGDWWIEAKTIERSAATREQDRQDLPTLRAEGIILRAPVAAQATPAGLIAKFQYQLDDAIRKWDRQNREHNLITFFNLEKIDFGITRDGTRAAIADWAAISERSFGVAIVIIENWRWQTPLYPSIWR